jgi:beta-glucanase (GH16 family)
VREYPQPVRRIAGVLTVALFLTGCGGESAGTDPGISTPPPITSSRYVVDFSKERDLSKFRVSDWTTWSLGTTFSPTNVALVNGELELTLTQVQQSDGSFKNTGGEVATLQEFGYGTFEWVAKMASSGGVPTSGNISAVFVYKVDSTSSFDTEIDFEQQGNRPDVVNLTTWTQPLFGTQETSEVPLSGQFDGYHTYTFTWAPSVITFAIDGVVVRQHYRQIGSITPVPAMMNLWGTNDHAWGGPATPGTVRMYVRSFTWTPPG